MKLSRNNKIQLIFDLDDTLYDLADPFYKAHKEIFPDYPELDCNQLFLMSRVHADEILHKEREGLIPREETLYLRIQRTYADAGILPEKEVINAFQEQYRYYQKHISLPEEIACLLDRCKELEIPMYILSNGKSIEQRNKIRALGLERWFHEKEIFVTEEIGYLKPHIRAFKGVEEATDAAPENIWYVGDTYAADVIGAKNAGWKVIWYNHRKRTVAENIADVTVENAKELLNTIESLAMNSKQEV